MSASRDGGTRTSELLASLALATDLGTGQPLERGLMTCVLAMTVGRAMGADGETLRAVHQFSLLRFLGCTSDAWETARLVAGDETAFLSAMAPATMGSPREQVASLVRSVARDAFPPLRAARLAAVLADPGGGHRSLSTHCETAVRLGTRLGCGPQVLAALAHAYERWDGKGAPSGLSGDAIPAAVRIVVAAGDLQLHARASGTALALEVLRRRRGRAYDPTVVDACLEVGPAELARLDAVPLWEEVMAVEPAPHGRLDDAALDLALTAVADFADLKSPWLRGHSRRVAALAEAAGRWCGLAEGDTTALRRAGLVHDVGRVGVPHGRTARSGQVGAAARERERLHPYLTERVLAQCAGLQSYAALAAAHHERLDGRGYHRGLRGAQLDIPARVLAAADLCALLRQGTPDRAGLDPGGVTTALRSAVDEGALDPAAVDAVLGVQAGTSRRGHHRAPAGLTGRETEVLRLLAAGNSNRQIASRLQLSVKTVGRHVENLYAKTQTHSRAAAAVFALEHGILPE
ncbi:MAG TPA: HD domain-containing phosphohydrolase [Intrasporangium sp.]|uniref:HD domain-containing phosphohydrolase n=1 Tax=Intrasporangium sp. TaxID=1925024 RepID=UPI002D77B17E|nr:HD domain-containing phosphohydrolase [Intrasporangium sp.]HET7397948.1 HD domain-containing phosphohydrolase [Intrasporangium sp.]